MLNLIIYARFDCDRSDNACFKMIFLLNIECNPIDLGILLDESGSVRPSNWPYVVNFAADLISKYYLL